MIDMLGHYFNLFAEVRHSRDAQPASARIALSNQPERRLDLGRAEGRRSLDDEGERNATKEDIFFWTIPPLI